METGYVISHSEGFGTFCEVATIREGKRALFRWAGRGYGLFVVSSDGTSADWLAWSRMDELFSRAARRSVFIVVAAPGCSAGSAVKDIIEQRKVVAWARAGRDAMEGGE